MKTILTTVAIAATATLSLAQGENLVPNPSFEETEKKVKRLGSIESSGDWISPTGARADLFTPGKVEDVDVPYNVYGKEEAKDGSNYAGVVAYSHGGKIPRSYIMTKLNSPLKKGMKYCVKFNVSLSEASKYATNNMGVVLSKRQFGMDAKAPIIEEPSVMHFNNATEVISARFQWTEICGTFVAQGGEKFITIGNFVSDDDTKDEKMKPDRDVKVSVVAAAYYYIDDVSVVLVDEEKGETCDCVSQTAETYSSTIYNQEVIITEETTDKEAIEMQQLFYGFGKDKLTPASEESLNMIAKIMKENPEMKLQIFGHNNEMEDEVAMRNEIFADMDNNRISVVYEYLIAQGIDAGRLLTQAVGSTSPSELVTDEDDDDLVMAKNRRVTFKVR